MDRSLRDYLGEGERAGLRYALSLPRHAPVGQVGGTLSQRAGSSLEFKDHRDYQPGDDLRHIDWNVYARSDQLTVKLYREEVTPHLDVVLDVSRSMALPETPKAGAALALAAFFAAAADNAGFSHAAWQMGAGYHPVGNGAGLPSTWEGISFSHSGGPSGVPGQGAPLWRPRGIRVLLSDLLWVGNPLATLRPLAERAAVCVVLQVLAAADVNPPEGQSLRLVDVETDQVKEIHVDAVAARRYREALARHQENWHTACRQTGALFAVVVAEEVLRDWRLDELVAAEVLKVK
jgi:uncharacterized protein (DUF58 family)